MSGPYRQYVLIGGYHRLRRAWMNARGIAAADVVEVQDRLSLVRLRGLRGEGLALVWFDVPPPKGHPVPSLIGLLRTEGAVDLPSTWWPRGGAATGGIGGTDETQGGEGR